jgi:hypothetical protein
MKNNVPLKGLFTRLKTDQKVRLKSAIWSKNSSQAKCTVFMWIWLEKAV